MFRGINWQDEYTSKPLLSFFKSEDIYFLLFNYIFKDQTRFLKYLSLFFH